jgi:hypothetical protein
MAIIYTRKNQAILIDDEDYEKVSKYSWQINHKGYARSEIKTKSILMHRYVMGATDPKIQVDHIFGNKLDNRKSQLRFCTNQQNQFNKSKNKNNKSGYKGVYWRSDRKRWVALISINGKDKRLGSFKNKLDAAIAYDNYAKEVHGEFVRLNHVQS